MTDEQTLTACSTCSREYDPADAAAVKLHTERIHGCPCSRCRGKPGCYYCQSCFCKCSSH